MKFSVIIPAYNASATIKNTLDSVYSQTVAPHEVLVFDDGSTDGTSTAIQSYPNVRLFRETNQGVAHARNFLVQQATGDIIAFLDADDVWHPSYLEVQQRSIESHPEAIAFFTNHSDLVGYGDFRFDLSCTGDSAEPRLISPKSFILEYNQRPLSFQMSCFCISSSTLAKLGSEPFCVKVSGADDTYAHNLLPLFGLILHVDLPLVAYRIISTSISENRLRMSLLVVDTFAILEPRYRSPEHRSLYATFSQAFASRKRNCGKFLMGAGDVMRARRLFFSSISTSSGILSLLKSFGLLISTFAPRRLQPDWPSGQRQVAIKR